ncbi:RBP11-like subunits of RNA polymerase [Zopfia rhizophila CBS 207.26]|uniref:RBP11-like subunits of RNA polymerase n=1 Tax=Zopfia rhizophila CBS 207.26 TaxID=1314779 RepID=A0A6A6DG91_9PEZI|nr:RBP11-like subunits of RNA polymerase [Zopfia rhizophila CBS 207.26]
MWTTIGRLVEHEPNSTLRNPNRKSNHMNIAHKADFNNENRFELFLLDDNEKKVEWEEETRIPNTAVFTFNKEDHTLGNLLSSRLHKYDYVTFSAYKVPHPLFAKFELRVTTNGSISPKDAIVKCCKDIVQDLEVLSRSFTTEWLGKRIVHEGEAERLAREREI